MPMPSNVFPVTLLEAYMLSPGVKHFVFQVEQSPAFDFLPGQFITIHFEHNDRILKRSYSIANPPSKNNRIEFAAGFVENGPGSALLFNLQKGDSIQINGPFGRLVLKDHLPKRYVLVATSTGLTPYRAMIPELHQRLTQDPALQVLILFGVQTAADALYQGELVAFAEAFPQQVGLRFQLSRTPASDLGPFEHCGYVQQAFPEIDLSPKGDVVYLCGNPAMIDAAFEDLKNRGFSIQQIIREKYISAP